MKIIIVNKIEEQVRKYQKKTGVKRIWLAEQLEMTPQNMYKIFNSTNMTLETLIKFAVLLDCQVSDLFKFYIE